MPFLPFSARPEAPRRGGALVLSLIVVLFVATLAAGFLQISSQVVKNREAARDKRASFYVAEAGLAEAYVGLTVGKTGNVGTATRPAKFGNGLFWVEATALSDDLVRLESNARVGTGVAVLALVAERGQLSVASLGMFANEALDVPPGSLIDGWDSREGSYEGQASLGLNDQGQLGTNSTLTASGTAEMPTRILGDATAGPNGTVTTQGDVEITGKSGPASAAQVLPPVVVPPLAEGNPVDLSSATPFVLPAGEWSFPSVVVRPGSDLVLQGPAVIVAQRIRLESDAKLTFDTTDGEISMVATEGLEFAGGSLVSTSSQDAAEVVIQVSGPTEKPVRLESESTFHGIVYAPEAEVILSGSFELFGALACAGLQFTSPVRLHFDRHLEDVAFEASLPLLRSWRILELGATPRGINNPFLLLGLDPAASPLPADAHADQLLHVMYVDAGGTTLTYDGMESGFDWTNVSEVLELTRDGEPVVGRARGHSQNMGDLTALTDYLGLTLPVTSFELTGALIFASPLPDQVVYYAIEEPLLENWQLQFVLTQNLPLSDVLVERLLLHDPPLDSTNLRNVLIPSSPLSATNLTELQNGAYLDPSDLALVLAAQ